MEGTDSQILMLTRQRFYAIPTASELHQMQTHERTSLEEMRRDHVSGLNAAELREWIFVCAGAVDRGHWNIQHS